MPRRHGSWANLLMGTALGLCACGVGTESRGGPDTARTVVAGISQAELDAYGRGTAAEIRLVEARLQDGAQVDWTAIDDVGAQAAGLPVDAFRKVKATVEATLKTRAAFAERTARLDSLRIQLMVLRVRAGVRP